MLIRSITFCEPFTPSLFFFNDTATTEIYTLSLHDALPILLVTDMHSDMHGQEVHPLRDEKRKWDTRSEEHTSELQSLAYLVCRLLLEKKKKNSYERI